MSYQKKSMKPYIEDFKMAPCVTGLCTKKKEKMLSRLMTL